MLKNSENDGTGGIGLVTPTPGTKHCQVLCSCSVVLFISLSTYENIIITHDNKVIMFSPSVFVGVFVTMIVKMI